MVEQVFRIIVVGGGIAGLATAVALREEGRHILVLEKSNMLREVGALISLQPNASKIVTKWEMDDFLATAEPVTDRLFRILDVDGNIVNDIPTNMSIYGADRVVYHRQDLHHALRDAALSESRLGNPVQIRTSAPVVHCDPVRGTVELKSGEILEADLIIGADGIRSKVRESVLKSVVPSVPTGLSAYRILVDIDKIKNVPCPKDIFDPEKPVTTLIMGHDRRVVMGPGKGFKLLGMVALLPDDRLNEISHSESWTTPGSVEKLLESYADFPPWLLEIFKASPDMVLWQLRDTPPLDTWVSGRTILIGDAAHAMLPTQGQGASQSIEDAEALEAFFADITSRPSFETINSNLNKIAEARKPRATLIQQYSRQQAKPATEAGSKKVTLNMSEFMDYNCRYEGIKDWIARGAAC